MKTKYVVIEPGPLTPAGLEALSWVDVEFAGADPSYADLMGVLRPLFDNISPERVAVNWASGPTDMFVGADSAKPDNIVNEAATLIYWTASGMHAAAEKTGKCGYAELRASALMSAADLFKLDPALTPARVRGRAVLFTERVWF